MVGCFHNRIVDAETLDRPARSVDGAGWRHLARESSELVGDNANLPGPVAIGQAEDFGWCLIFVPRTEWAGERERREFPRRAVDDQLLGALGALGRDDDPFLGEEILA